MVMSRWSVHLTTLFSWASLTKPVASRAAMFTKFGKRLQEFQQLKQFRLHVTSRLNFFIMQIGKIADIFPKNHLKNVTCANIQNCF